MMTTCSRNQLFTLSVANSGKLWTQLLTVSIKFSDSQKIVYITQKVHLYYFVLMVLYFLVYLVRRYVRPCVLRVCTFEIFECLCLFRVCIFKMLLCLCLWRVCVLIFLRCPCLYRVCRQDEDNGCLRTRLSVSV